MSTLLDVFAIPRQERSRTRRIREAFLQGYKRSRPAAGIVSLDLAKRHAELPVFDDWDVETKFEVAYGEGKLDAEMARRWNALTALTDQLHAASAVVVSCPMWNFTVPWMMKRWLDAVVQPRLTFEYRGETPVGLLTGRPAVIIATRDGSYGAGTSRESWDFQVPYLKHVLGFIGLGPIHVVVAEPLSMLAPEPSSRALEVAMVEAEKLGASL